jgi:hypothetical protein
VQAQQQLVQHGLQEALRSARLGLGPDHSSLQVVLAAADGLAGATRPSAAAAKHTRVAGQAAAGSASAGDRYSTRQVFVLGLLLRLRLPLALLRLSGQRLAGWWQQQEQSGGRGGGGSDVQLDEAVRGSVGCGGDMGSSLHAPWPQRCSWLAMCLAVLLPWHWLESRLLGLADRRFGRFGLAPVLVSVASMSGYSVAMLWLADQSSGGQALAAWAADLPWWSSWMH